jgi:hypothetical protein
MTALAIMPDTPTRNSRRLVHLGPLSLVIAAEVPFHLIAGWLPHTNIEDDEAPAAAISVIREPRPVEPPGAPQLVVGSVRVWEVPGSERALALTPGGHARLDFRGALAHLDPGRSVPEADELLTVTSGLILARVGAALLEATALLDTSGWCWLALGAPELRTTLARAFCEDGGNYVSDGRVLLRRAALTTDVIVAESWHYERDRREGRALPWDRWRPLGPVRGLLLVEPGSSRGAARWLVAEPQAGEAAVSAAVQFIGADAIADRMVKSLAHTCGKRLALTARIARDAGGHELQPLKKLAAALEDFAL